MRSPRVFISYSHDSEAHKDRVLGLADRLRQDGVDAILDRYEVAPPHGWASWMHEQIENAEFVLMICTKIYYRRLMKREQPGVGLGGVWEGHLILTNFYLDGAKSNKFVPVLIDRSDLQWVPLEFASLSRYALDAPDGYDDLYRRLSDQPLVQRSEMGALRALPARDAKWRDRPKTTVLGVPGSPQLFLGRSEDLSCFKHLLGVLPEADGSSDPLGLTSVIGLPGVGKTTFVSALPRDPDIQATYTDGILWMAFGQSNPRDLKVSILSTLADWAVQWDGGDSFAVQTLPQVLQEWRVRLRGRRVLLVIDDVWDANLAYQLASILEVGGSAIVTSRTPAIAERIVPAEAQRFALHELSPKDALLLLTQLAPDAVSRYRSECETLVDDLGCLPLAIIVAGGMLGSERGRAIGIPKLLTEIREGQALLAAEAPADMVPLLQEDTLLSVAALLQRSIKVLEPDQQLRFAKLGVFAPKPATIDLPMLAAVWQDTPDNVIATAGLFVDHGIMQVTRDGKFQVHALLSKLAVGMLQAL